MFANVKVPFPGDAIYSRKYTSIIYLHLLAINYASGLPVFIINTLKQANQ